ncbi:MAG: hypothetical protein IJ567_11210 [Lachnospiraceae bacterium]|nr:hypothetical protein [Lachnospiraceae bacterium]
MTGVEIILVLVGLILMVGSFMVTEKLSGRELNRISQLSETEIRTILEKQLAAADSRIDDQIEDAIAGSVDKVERSLDKATNEKMMAINEFSDTILESMNKTHNEIMFLYSMLNDKHAQLTDFASKLEQIKTQIIQEMNRLQEEAERAPVETASVEEHIPVEKGDGFNHNDEILALYRQGLRPVEIARELNLGTGEVQLVIELFKGDSGL